MTMDLSAAVAHLGTSFQDVGTKVSAVGIKGFAAVAACGLVYVGLRFIIHRFGLGGTKLDNTVQWHGDGTLSDWGQHYEDVKAGRFHSGEPSAHDEYASDGMQQFPP